MTQEVGLKDARVGFRFIEASTVPATVNYARFQGRHGVEEYDLVVRPAAHARVETQLGWMEQAYQGALDSLGLEMGTCVFRRFFCSDLTNQGPALAAHAFSNPDNAGDPCAVSWVGQPPADPEKVAFWAHHVCDPDAGLVKTFADGALKLHRGELDHHYMANSSCLRVHKSYDQSRGILDDYNAYLNGHGMTLAGNVIRTWFFVRHVDVNYEGLVVARRELFERQGLTRDTHFIASTGIEGAPMKPRAKVAMDAYAIAGVRAEQIRYLEALDHLGPTHVYGVTFERATAVDFRDRRHIYISGTASIDPEGNILHEGDVSRQLDRSLDNVEALLRQGGARLEDMSVCLAYVRDPSDHQLVWRRMRERFGDAPIEVVVAPVCRPGWLIELEGKAVVPVENPELPLF